MFPLGSTATANFSALFNVSLFSKIMIRSRPDRFPETGKNLYDVRRPCGRQKDGPLCYRELTWIETYLNDAEVKAALGVQPDLKFASCNMEINQAFLFQGDGSHNSAILLPDLINDGIRLLVYAGNAGMCPYSSCSALQVTLL